MRIYIIQSLSDNEPQTGMAIFREIDDLNKTLRAGVNVTIKNKNTKRSFLRYLNEIAASVVVGEQVILHIECHGDLSQTGLALTDGDRIMWTELKPYLTEINVACRMGLIVMMMSCSGGHAAAVVTLKDVAPFRALIGPTDLIYVGELEAAMSKFYRDLLKNWNVSTAFWKMLSVQVETGGFHMTEAVDFFKEGLASFVIYQQDPTRLIDRVASIHSSLKRLGILMNPMEIIHEITLNEGNYSSLRDQFFMIDGDRRNNSNFDIEYAELREYISLRALKSTSPRSGTTPPLRDLPPHATPRYDWQTLYPQS